MFVLGYEYTYSTELSKLEFLLNNNMHLLNMCNGSNQNKSNS